MTQEDCFKLYFANEGGDISSGRSFFLPAEKSDVAAYKTAFLGIKYIQDVYTSAFKLDRLNHDLRIKMAKTRKMRTEGKNWHLCFNVSKIWTIQILARGMLQDAQCWPFRPVDGTFKAGQWIGGNSVRLMNLWRPVYSSTRWAEAPYGAFDVRPLARHLRTVQASNGAFGLSADLW